MKGRTALRISNDGGPGGGPRHGKDTKIEIRKPDSGEWIDISDTVRAVDIRLAVDEVITAKVEMYPSAVMVDGEPLSTFVLGEPLSHGDYTAITEEDEVPPNPNEFVGEDDDGK